MKSKSGKLVGIALIALSSAFGCGEAQEQTKSPEPANKSEKPAIPQSALDKKLSLADAALQVGAYQDAKNLYEQVLLAAPNNLRARKGVKLKDVSPEAFAEAQALQKKAKNQSFLGKLVAAYRILKEANSVDPNNQEIETLFASSALLVHRHHEAQEVFRSQFQEDPSLVDSLIGWAEAAFGSRDFESVMEALDRMQIIEKASEEDERIASHLCELWFIKGTAASNLYRFPEAIDVLNRASKRQPRKVRYRNALARTHLEAGNFENALMELAELERLAPSTKLLYYHQGKALERLGRVEESIAAYRTELKRDKHAWRVAIDCARAYVALGGEKNLLLGLSYLEQALSVNPRSHEALFTQQSVYRKLGNIDESKRVNALYQKLIDFKSDRESELRALKTRINENPRDFEAWLGIISIRSRFNPLQDVLNEVYDLLNVEPRQVDGLWHLTNLLMVQEKFTEAYFQATKLADVAPEDSRGFSLAAAALNKMGRHQEALTMARQAVTMNPQDGGGLEALVEALRTTNPQGRELELLLPRFERMKAEEARALKELQSKEDALNRRLGK